MSALHTCTHTTSLASALWEARNLVFISWSLSWQIKSWISVQPFKSLEQKAPSKQCINSLFVFEKGNRWTKSWKKEERNKMWFYVVKFLSHFQKWLILSTWCYCTAETKGNAFATIFFFFGMLRNLFIKQSSRLLAPLSPVLMKIWHRAASWKKPFLAFVYFLISLVLREVMRHCQARSAWVLDCRGHLTAAL